MRNELITLNKALPIHNGTIGSTGGNSLINYFVSIAILAEMAVSRADDFPWLIEEKLNKRRNSYELDKHLQNMLLFLNGKKEISAKCIECGNSNYYKTEVVLGGSIYIHFCRNFDKTSNYNQQYIEMNRDASRLGFCCFEYTLSKDKTTVTDISLLIPRPNESDIKIKLPINLTAIRNNFKNAGKSIETQLDSLTWHDAQTDTPATDTPRYDDKGP
mgnify:FL=1